MQYAKVNGLRAAAEPKLKGTCEHCGSEVRSKCGSKIVWHWAHISIESCDSWYEPETQWHRQWKNHFGSDCSEISILKSNIKHIADVLTKDNLVIEFQNSPISAETINSREQFYDKMIWVINGEPFKKNFTYFDKDFLTWELKTEIIVNPQLLKSQPNARVLIVHANNIVHKPIHDILLRFKFVYNKIQNIYSFDLKGFNNASAVKDKVWAEVYSLYNRSKIESKQKKLLYTWNKPRISWQDATKPIFIDFNEDYLIWIKTNIGYKEGEAIKVMKKDFLAKYNPVISDSIGINELTGQ